MIGEREEVPMYLRSMIEVEEQSGLKLDLSPGDRAALIFRYRHADKEWCKARLSLRSGSYINPAGQTGKPPARTGDAAENAIIHALKNAGRVVRVNACLDALSPMYQKALKSYFGEKPTPLTWASRTCLMAACKEYTRTRKALDENSLERDPGGQLGEEA